MSEKYKRFSELVNKVINTRVFKISVSDDKSVLYSYSY